MAIVTLPFSKLYRSSYVNYDFDDDNALSRIVDYVCESLYSLSFDKMIYVKLSEYARDDYFTTFPLSYLINYIHEYDDTNVVTMVHQNVKYSRYENLKGMAMTANGYLSARLYEPKEPTLRDYMKDYYQRKRTFTQFNIARGKK